MERSSTPTGRTSGEKTGTDGSHMVQHVGKEDVEGNVPGNLYALDFILSGLVTIISTPWYCGKST